MAGRQAAAVAYLLLGPPEVADGLAPDWPALLIALGALSPAIEAHPPGGCWLALPAGRREPAIDAQAASIAAAARELGFAGCHVGVAPTPGVARLAATCADAAPAILAPADVAAFLAPLPVAVLGLADDEARRLAAVGLHTLGAIAALPRGGLGDYLGAAGPPIEAAARGEDRRRLIPTAAPLVVEARRALDHALADRARLDALVDRLLAPLLADLARRGLGATRARLTLELEGVEPRTVEVPLPAPTLSPRAVLGPLRAALGRVADEDADAGAGDDEGVAPGGVTAVAVALVAPRALVTRQLGLFDVPTGRLACIARGVQAASRRGGGRIGHWARSAEAHPAPGRDYVFVEAARGEGEGEGA